MRAHNLIVVIVLVLSVHVAHAQEATAPKPWAAGVSDAEQATALELYERGNVEFQNARFAQALEQYEQAIKHWDHPAIRYNMAICLNSLGNLLAAEDNLERSLKFGEEPLGHDIYVQGLNYQTNFAGRLARVKIICKEPGTTVSLDGQTLFTAPGEVEKLLVPGDAQQHLIVATKPGYLTASESLTLVAGTSVTHEIRLIAMKPATRLVRRWQPWKPWAIGAAGVATASLGALAYHFASRDYAAYDAGIAARCPTGCDAGMLAGFHDLATTEHHGDVDYAIAIALFSVGGAAIATSVVGLVLNQPHPVAEHLTPVPTPGGMTLGVHWQF